MVEDRLKEAGAPPSLHPRALGYRANAKQKGWFDSSQPSLEEIGPLEAVVCTHCGYVEYYVRSPKNTRFQDMDGFKWL